MNEYQRKWLLYLQEKGVEFENVSVNGKTWYKGTWEFKNDPKDYRTPVQPIPDIPDWRKLCREMRSNGVRFKMLWGSMWSEGVYDFENERYRYQICEQPLPEWREEMTEETKPDPREEIPHRELQIQWHEDMLVQLKNGEKPNLRNWEYRIKEPGLKTLDLDLCPNMWHSMGCRYDWNKDFEYRRKPRTVTYWHCLVRYVTGAIEFEVISGVDKQEMLGVVEEYKQYAEKNNQQIKFGPITETIIELEG